MKKLISWKTANKLSIIFGIIGGLWLLYNVSSFFIGNKLNVDAEIFVEDFKLPKKLKHLDHYTIIKKGLAENLTRFELAVIILDNLNKKIKDDNLDWITVDNSIPIATDKFLIHQKLDSVISKTYSSINSTELYYETSLENLDNKIIQNIRLEIPGKGYYELYENSNLRIENDFENIIDIGNLRSSNNILVKIWSKNLDHRLDDIKYTHQNGVIKPLNRRVVLKNRIISWIYKNTFLRYYLFLLFFWLIFIFGFSSKKDNINT